MTRFIPTDERVAARIFDALTAEGVTPGHAALIGQAALAEMRRDNRLPELFVMRQVDFSGEPHAVVVRKLPPDDPVPLYRFDILAMRRAARQTIAREFEVDLTEGHAGTEV